MSFTAKALGDLMFAYFDQSGTAGPTGDVDNASATEKAFIALAMTQAVQLARKLNPRLFLQRPGIVLRAPSSGTITVTQFSTATTLGTLTVPNDGCTVRIGGGLDNQLNVTATPGTYALAREHEGSGGSGVFANLWHDCWVAADGTTYGSILGNVRANGRPIDEVTSADQLDLFHLIRDYGQYSLSQARVAGPVRAVCCDQWASPYTNKIQTRLRFAPMPDAATVIEADLIVAAPVFTAEDVVDTDVTFQVPQQLDELLLFPLAMHFLGACPFFRPIAETRQALQDQYAVAADRISSLRGHYAASNGSLG